MQRRWSTVHNTHRKEWSTSRAESAKPKDAASFRLSELQVQRRRSTVHSTRWRGWSTSRAKSVEPKAAASFHVSELQVRKRGSTVHSTHRGGMVDVKSRKCRTEGCDKLPSFGVTGTKTVEYCAQHAPEGMVNVKNRKHRTKLCGKKPSFGVTNTRTAEYRAQQTRLQCGVEGFREREVGPHHSGKKTIANVITSVAKHTSICPPPTKTSQPSGASRDSCKRARQPEIASTASKRAVAREPTAGGVTIPDIDGQKSPVKRDSSVKIEVQISL